MEKVSKITGLTGEEITTAARMIMENGPMAMQEGNADIIHHKNGMQNYRAIDALSAITGHYDRKGGQMPTGFKYFDPTLPTGAQTAGFLDEVRPKNAQPKIGTDRFPLWSELIDEFQAMDMARHILEQNPYPLKALFAMGLNVRMFPNDADLFKALETIDFYVDLDMFMTDSAKYADLVLPACSSFERSELRSKGAALFYTNPGIGSNSTITVKANITLSVLKGMINMLHGYSEADVNSIIVPNPYSGFPGYRTVRCTVRRQTK